MGVRILQCRSHQARHTSTFSLFLSFCTSVTLPIVPVLKQGRRHSSTVILVHNAPVTPHRSSARSKPKQTVFRTYTHYPWQQTQWEKPTMPNSTGHDGLNDTNVEPSAAPSARYVAKVDGPSRSSSSRQREERPCAAKADGPARKSSNRKREELPYGERIFPGLLSCYRCCVKMLWFPVERVVPFCFIRS